MMDESEDPDIDQPESPGPYPDLDYRERGHFPSDPDESSMEKGKHPSSGEQETESEPPEEPDLKYQLDIPLQNENSP